MIVQVERDAIPFIRFGQTYHNQKVTVNKVDYYNVSLKPIRFATKEEYIKWCEDNNTDFDWIPNSTFVEIQVD